MYLAIRLRARRGEVFAPDVTVTGHDGVPGHMRIILRDGVSVDGWHVSTQLQRGGRAVVLFVDIPDEQGAALRLREATTRIYDMCQLNQCRRRDHRHPTTKD